MKTDAELMNEFFETNHYEPTVDWRDPKFAALAKYSPDQPREPDGKFGEGDDKTEGFHVRKEGENAGHEDLDKTFMRAGHLYRGMTQAEYSNTVGAGKGIKSNEAFSTTDEGTSLTHEPSTAESYANYGRDDPRKSGNETYLVEVKTDSAKLDSDGYYKAKNGVPQSDITRVWEMRPEKGAVVAHRIDVEGLAKYSPDQPREPDGRFGEGDNDNNDGSGILTTKTGLKVAVTYKNGAYFGHVDGKNVATVNITDDAHHVVSVTVDPDYQKKGIASAMYDHIERHIGHALAPSPTHQSPSGQALWASRAKKFAKYSPDQPRDDHGRFGSGGNSIPLTEDGKKQAQENYNRQRDAIALRGEAVARQMDFPVDKISYNADTPPTFQLNGKTVEYAGAANLKTGAITIYTRNTPDEKSMDYVMSHEIGHQMYQPVVDEFRAELQRANEHERIERTDAEGNVRMMPLMRPDGSMREDGVDSKLLAQLKEAFPVWSNVGKVDNASTSQELQEKDGVSQYSREWWQAAVDGTATRHQAMHETMAEITRIVYESKRDTGKMWGSEEAKQVKPVWRKYFSAYNKAFKAMKKKS